MRIRFTRIYPLLALIIMAGLAWLDAGLWGNISAYVILMLVPGFGLYLLLERHPKAPESLLAAVALSPVITCGIGILFMVAGASPEQAATGDLAIAGLVGLAGLVWFAAGSNRSFTIEFSRRQWTVVGLCVLSVLVLVGYLPMTSEWWRFRSDAWFHRAVVAQISHTGLPPEDPYFAGFELQYMWFYHATVVVINAATGLDPFRVMTALNLQGFCSVFMAVMLFAGVFVSSFAKRLGSCITVVFGLNGLFWLFLPIKAARAFVGDVRGMDELVRVFSLSPLTIEKAMSFLYVWHNQDFLLDKFVVATAFSTALACLSVFWFATSDYLRSRRPFTLIAAVLALVGMLGFHTLFGMVMFVAAFGGMGLSFLFRRSVTGYRLRSQIELAAACGVAVIISAPYLYAITHLKRSENVFPFALSIDQIIGIVISALSAAVLAAFQREFFKNRGVVHRYLQYAILTLTVYCALIYLPRGGSFDKIPVFVFFPLAVIGGWSLPGLIGRWSSGMRKASAVVIVAVLFFVPVNAISFIAYFNTPTEAMYTADEEAVAAWVREHTPREAVFIDRNDEMFLLVAGPRRYYFARYAYASEWGYDRLVMSGRMHARDALFRAAPLDVTTLRLLGEAPWELYAIDRRERADEPSALTGNASLFKKVFTAGSMDLYRVDTAACAAAAREKRDAGFAEIPEEDILRESGL